MASLQKISVQIHYITENLRYFHAKGFGVKFSLVYILFCREVILSVSIKDISKVLFNALKILDAILCSKLFKKCKDFSLAHHQVKLPDLSDNVVQRQGKVRIDIL